MRKVYLNPKQSAFLNNRQIRRTFQGGRGSGKSTVLGFILWMFFNYMPRSKIFIAGLTYSHILTKTLPALEEALTACGLKEYDPKTGLGHYVVCRKPPAHFAKPYQPPRKYEYCISFITGFTVELLSLDSPDSSRGGNYDAGFIDESALITRDVVFKILRPMIRGNIYRFDHYLHQLFADFTSAAWLPQGQWIYETQDLAKEFPDEYLYIESDAYDNVEVLGKRYIEGLRKEMTTLEFDVEVMNKRMAKLPNCYYPAFNEKKHCVWKTFDYNYNDDNGLWIPTDNDIDPKLPIDTGWDFNAKIVSCVVAQHNGRQYSFVDYLYSKESNKSIIEECCDKFIETFASHQCKEVFIYGDATGLNKREDNPNTFYETIQTALEKAGWNVVMKVKRTNPPHKTRHSVINQILSEDKLNMPIVRFNQTKCKYVIISMNNSPITPDWKKNKDSERTLIDQERATHASDCIDYMLIGRFSNLFGIQDYYIGEVSFIGK